MKEIPGYWIVRGACKDCDFHTGKVPCNRAIYAGYNNSCDKGKCYQKREENKMQDTDNKEDTIEDIVNKMIPNDKKAIDIPKAIRQTCQELCDFLVVKNKSYGNSIFAPMRVFSRTDTIEQINVRIDDKLSRLKRGDTELIQEDTEKDLIGYLILKRVLTQVLNKEKGNDNEQVRNEDGSV